VRVQMASEIAAPLSQAKKLTMVSGGSSEVGVSKITTEVLQVVERLPKLVEGITGVDIAKVSLYVAFVVFICCIYMLSCVIHLVLHCQAGTVLVCVNAS